VRNSWCEVMTAAWKRLKCSKSTSAVTDFNSLIDQCRLMMRVRTWEEVWASWRSFSSKLACRRFDALWASLPTCNCRLSISLVSFAHLLLICFHEQHFHLFATRFLQQVLMYFSAVLLAADAFLCLIYLNLAAVVAGKKKKLKVNIKFVKKPFE
jgi:hypothetical protein